MIQTPSTMRLAFTAAVADVPRTARTRTYAMVCSALNRKLGLTRRRSWWSVERVRR